MSKAERPGSLDFP